MRLLLVIDNMHIEVAGVQEPVFSRVFSILGYPWANDPQIGHRSRLTLLRVAPGSIPVVYPRLLPLKGSIRLVEGKSDLAVVSANGPSDFLRLQHDIAEDPTLRSYIQKVETHLVFTTVPSEGTGQESLSRILRNASISGVHASKITKRSDSKQTRRCLDCRESCVTQCRT